MTDNDVINTEDFDDDDFAANDGESTELSEHFRFVADSGQELVRIDKFLDNRIAGISAAVPTVSS